MKKYLIIILLFFVFFIVLFYKRSYAYVDCSNVIVKPEGVTTLNLKNYLNKFEYKEIYYVCSYDCCYNVKNGDKDDIVNNLTKILDKTTNDDDKLFTNVNGFSITKIGLNVCK